MGTIIAVSNNKGGVGKTTSTAHIGEACRERGMRVLLIDADPQGNLTTTHGVDKRVVERTIGDVLTLSEEEWGSVIRVLPAEEGQTPIHIIPANRALREAEQSKVKDISILQLRLTEIASAYDVILIDCPPNLGALTMSAIRAADLVLSPMQCQYLSAESLDELADAMKTVRQVRRLLNLRSDWRVFATMKDGRLKEHSEILAGVRDALGETMLQTVIPHRVRLQQWARCQATVFTVDPSSDAVDAYRELTAEVGAIYGWR